MTSQAAPIAIPKALPAPQDCRLLAERITSAALACRQIGLKVQMLEVAKVLHFGSKAGKARLGAEQNWVRVVGSVQTRPEWVGSIVCE